MCELWTYIMVGTLIFLFGVLPAVIALWMKHNRKVKHDQHVLNGRVVDIPVMDGDTFSNNIQEAGRIQARQER